jgi:hypothetical protein
MLRSRPNWFTTRCAWLAAISVAALAGPAIALAIPATPAMAYGTNVELSVHNGGGSCATVKNSSNTLGETILLTHPCSGDDKWEEVPVTCPLPLGAQRCIAFKDIHNTSLCIGETSVDANVTLQHCTAGFSNWYAAGNYNINNVAWSGGGGWLTVGSNTNGAVLYGEWSLRHGDQQWNCTGGC